MFVEALRLGSHQVFAVLGFTQQRRLSLVLSDWSAPPLPVDVDLHNKDVQQEIFACLDAAPLRHTLACLLREVEELPTEDICTSWASRGARGLHGVAGG